VPDEFMDLLKQIDDAHPGNGKVLSKNGKKVS
jgi:hypothetical protein